MGSSDFVPYRAPCFDQSSLHPAFRAGFYRFRRRFFELFAARIDIYDGYLAPVMHCKQKAFRLREDIRLFSDPSRTEELLAIQARQIIDFSAAYDVWDQTGGGFVGTLRRRGWTSLIRDLWEFCDSEGQIIGHLQEDSMVLALLRRFLTNLVPQHFHVTLLSGELAAHIRQHFNPFIYWLDVSIAGGSAPLIDPRLVLAAATLVAVIEGRQE